MIPLKISICLLLTHSLRPSPGAFYVYNTIKIITAAQVTGKDGLASCATVSSWESEGGFGAIETGHGIPTFTVNGNAEAYFGGPDIAGQTSLPTATSTYVGTHTRTYSRSTPPYTTTETNTATFTEKGVFYTNSNGDLVTQDERPTGVTISLVTPFIYAPERGAKGETGEGRACLQSGESVNYGWVPQSLVDHLASNEQYQSQYPGIESCLPGGPSILRIKECSSVLPTFVEAGGDLTSGTIIYVTPEGVQQPTTTEAPVVKPTSTWTSDDYPPTTQTPATELVPTSTSDDYPPTTQTPATELVPTTTSDDYPPTTQTPAIELLPTTESNAAPNTPPSASAIFQTPVPEPTLTPPIPPAVVFQSVEPTQTPIGSIINSILSPPSPSPNNPPPIVILPTTIPVAIAPPGLTGQTTTLSNTAVIIVSAATTIPPAPALTLPSGLGITTTINNTPFLIIPSQTTIHIPPTGLPSGLGSTTTISGTPFVVIQPTTIPIPTQNPGPDINPISTPLPGQLTIISGTTNLVFTGPTTVPVNPQFSVDGSTIVQGGTTEVVVSGPTTVVVSGVVGTSTVGGVEPFTGGAGGRKRPGNLMAMILVGTLVGVVGVL